MPLLAFIVDRDSAANVWLRENPLVISAIALVLGLVLVYFGVTGLRSGVTKDKFGNELTGKGATVNSWVRLIGGVGAIGVAIYVAIFGAW